MSDAGDKLARTRLAIIDHVHRREPRSRREDAQVAAGLGDDHGDEVDERATPRSYGQRRWFGSVKRAALAWWRHHPAHLGLEVATPLLSAYAGRNPALYLGVAAVLGAVVVVARPWRLISLTGLVVALVKSSQLSSMVMSAMSAADFERDHRPRR